MSDNALQSFGQGVASYLTSCIFPALVAGLSNDGYDTSVEKLLQYASLPTIKSVPSMTASTAAAKKKVIPAPAPVSTPSVGTNGEEYTALGTPFVLGKTCAYKFKRGPENKGKYCGKTTQNGSKFCNIKSHKNSEEGATVNPGIAPEIATHETEESPNRLDVEPYNDKLGLYKEKTHGFIVTEADEGVVVIGRLSSDNVIVDLTENEKDIAQKIGLHLPVVKAEQTTTPVTTVTQTIPIIPVRSNVPVIPTIPTIPTF